MIKMFTFIHFTDSKGTPINIPKNLRKYPNLGDVIVYNDNWYKVDDIIHHIGENISAVKQNIYVVLSPVNPIIPISQL